MKRSIIVFQAILLCSFLFLFSCASDSKSGVTVQEEKKVIQKIDSISTELDKKSTKVKENTKKMKDEVDKLLDGI